MRQEGRLSDIDLFSFAVSPVHVIVAALTVAVLTGHSLFDNVFY